MLTKTLFHFGNLPFDKADSVLLIPFRYFPEVTPEWMAYERDVLKEFPEAMAEFLFASRLLSLYPGELCTSRDKSGWKAICVAPVTVGQGGIESIHFYEPYCLSAMQSFRSLLLEGFPRVPPAYIAVPEDPISADMVVRSAKAVFKDSHGFYVGLFQRPKHKGEKRGFEHPIAVSAILARKTDACPELGIRPLRRS